MWQARSDVLQRLACPAAHLHTGPDRSRRLGFLKACHLPGNEPACLRARLLATSRSRNFSGQSGRLSLNEPARVSRSLLRLRKNRRDPCAAELPSAGRGADCTDPGIAGRACAEYVVQIPGIDKPFIFMANHFSSKGSDPTGLKRRLPQATQVEKIVADRLDQGLTTL